jgi:hypothetical protein
LLESFGDESTSCGTETVVVEIEVLERSMFAEKRTEWFDSVQTKSIVVQVDGVEFRTLQESGKEGVESGRDLREESSGEEIGEVGDAEGLLRREEFGERLGGFDADGVAFEVHFFDVRGRLERADVLLEVGGGV